MARKKRKTPERKQCIKCRKESGLYKFYQSNSIYFEDGYMPMCKDCVRDSIDENNLESLLDVLRQINIPFIKSVWLKAKQSSKNTVGEYFRMINSLPQYSNMTYSQSDPIDDDDFNNEKPDQSDRSQKRLEADIDMIKFWGDGYTPEEYLQLQDWFDQMASANDLSAPQDFEMVKTLAILNVERSRCMQQKDYSNWTRLNEQYLKILQSSGLRAIDRKSASESKGIKSFGQLVAEVEKRGFIVPAKTKERQDIVDATILHLENFYLKLMNMETMVQPPPDTPKVEDYLDDGGDDNDHQE